MSGPKVVRIVTREELEAICRRHIRIFDDAAASSLARAKRSDMDAAALEADIARRRKHLRSLLEAERWSEVQRQAPGLVDFVRSEAEALEARAIAAAEKRRSKRRITGDAARSLAKAFEDSNQAVPAELRSVIANAESCSEHELEAMQGVIAQSFGQHVASRANQAASDTSASLARKLGEGEVGQSYADWLARTEASRSQSDKRLDALLAELEVLDSREVAEQFLQRARAISLEVSSAQRALLTDSLVMDVSSQSVRQRKAREVRAKLEDAKASIAELSSDVAKALGLALIGRSIRHRMELADAELKQVAEASRRRAVLRGLSTLGYEVRENMATAWAANGRIVVRKPGGGDYGVELAAPGGATQVQVRVVGASKP